jgi:hypothetical protein
MQYHQRIPSIFIALILLSLMTGACLSLSAARDVLRPTTDVDLPPADLPLSTDIPTLTLAPTPTFLPTFTPATLSLGCSRQPPRCTDDDQHCAEATWQRYRHRSRGSSRAPNHRRYYLTISRRIEDQPCSPCRTECCTGWWRSCSTGIYPAQRVPHDRAPGLRRQPAQAAISSSARSWS